jgi:predicted acylesterase/phospholipase RssA
MSYSIEVTSLGDDLYEVLRIAVARLNCVQTEFVFRLTEPPERADGSGFDRREYVTDEIWPFLDAYLKKFGGNRPHVIAFVNRPLRSAKTANLFGSHDMTGRFAAATLHNCAQYVNEEARFVSYYLVRYALSFVNPTIRSHDDPARRNCYFHKKWHKPDIVHSMDSGSLCDECARLLDNPIPGSLAHILSANEREALRKMRAFIAGLLPHAIVMKGGGIKGLAFAGALLELEEYYHFDRHVGTSAGAITAALLAADYKPAELKGVLYDTDFGTFFDANLVKAFCINLPFRRGLFPGDEFKGWLERLLLRKIPKLDDVRMEHLNGAVFYAVRSGSGAITFDSLGSRKETPAAFAARCSMSIPYAFFPQMIDGKRTFDGGIRENFPFRRFRAENPTKPVIALYLGKPAGPSPKFVLPELINLVLDGEERATVDENAENVVVIDTSPVGTLDFTLTNDEKDFLVKVGRAAALAFLLARKFNDGPSAATVDAAAAEAARAKQVVVAFRQKRRRKRQAVWAALCLAAAAAVYFSR